LKIILFAMLLFVMAGCSSHRADRYRIEEMPARSVPRSEPQEYPAPEPMLPPPHERETPSRRSPRPPRIEMPTTHEIPIHTSAENTRTSVAHYETNFDTADEGRGSNIALAASAINNKVIKPGETFSFNNTIGSTTGERGYKKSIIFVDGQKSEGYGGGVCQVSTTLCNAAHRAGMTILERHDHSRPVDYVGDGLQAATSHNGGLDFKFQNDTPHPVVIHANADNGTVRVSVTRA